MIECYVVRFFSSFSCSRICSVSPNCQNFFFLEAYSQKFRYFYSSCLCVLHKSTLIYSFMGSFPPFHTSQCFFNFFFYYRDFCDIASCFILENHVWSDLCFCYSSCFYNILFVYYEQKSGLCWTFSRSLASVIYVSSSVIIPRFFNCSLLS